MRPFPRALLLAANAILFSLPALNASAGCFRYAPGSPVIEPEDLYSKNGVLTVSMSYQTSTDSNGNRLFCYVLPDGNQSPTLHIKPGDSLVLTITNDTPVPAQSDAMQMQVSPPDQCGAATMNGSSTNVHFHGTNTAPVCHQDEVIHTLINSGESFTYNVQFPTDEPPGEYWYHPHVHGLSEMAVLGGATGALIVDGIENLQHAVTGLPQRVLVVRDNVVPGDPDTPPAPAKDVSLNFVPIPYPSYPPAVITMNAGASEFWRVANTSADTVIDVQLQYDRKPQLVQIVALDGVPVGSQDGSGRGQLLPATHVLIPPAGRGEFIVQSPGPKVKVAQFVTRNVDTGPGGDLDPARPLANIQTTKSIVSAQAIPKMPIQWGLPNPQRFVGLLEARVTNKRKLYFSETETEPQTFFITVDGQTPVAFNPDLPPAITTTQGSVEQWTIENRTSEVHAFHIHQIHYLLEAVNGIPVPPGQRQFFDTVDVPYWTGKGPYPSITVRMDFRGPVVGDFVYHCHILEHEDGGMMAIIRVLPQGSNLNAATPASPGVSKIKQVLAPTTRAPLCRSGKLVKAAYTSGGL
ncbi:MAG TPA: multicopper oxidase domain-containing protein [Candidatus Binataceae bacterium]|nr:multicopper oxidase domain-containing protein [Candidatus Binataceae bacterium]